VAVTSSGVPGKLAQQQTAQNQQALKNADAFAQWLSSTNEVDLPWYLSLAVNQQQYLQERWIYDATPSASIKQVKAFPKTVKPVAKFDANTTKVWTLTNTILKSRGANDYRTLTGTGGGDFGPPKPAATAVPTTPTDIKALQAQLNAQGYTDAQGKPLKVDGIMGPRTKAALAKRDGGQPPSAPVAASGGGGGGKAARGGGGGTTVAAATAPAKPVDPTQFARETYGYLSYFLDDPEIGSFLKSAAEKGWSKEVMQGELFKTQWWQKQSETTRNWLALSKTDPATAEFQITQRTADLTNKASVLGIGLTPDRARQIATDSLRYGWNDTQLQTALANEINFAGVQVGGIATLMQGLTEASKDYLIPISTPTLQSWTKQIIGGTQTEENFKAYLVTQAKSLFPYLANALDTGMSVRQYVDPYVQMAAKTLELNPADIDLTQAKWLAPLQRVDPATGQRGVMSLSDWDREMRMNPTYGYDRTQGARDQAASLSADLARMFGRVG
jgi:hypothetical protein